jgi:hypothetical protein
MPGSQPQTTPVAPTSLYERLGGVYSIAAVVDDFIDRIMDDPRLNANPKVDEAHHRVSRAGFKYLVTEMEKNRWELILHSLDARFCWQQPRRRQVS